MDMRIHPQSGSVSPLLSQQPQTTAVAASGKALPADGYTPSAEIQQQAEVRDEQLTATLQSLDSGLLKLPGAGDIRSFEKQFNQALAEAGIDNSQEIELQIESDGSVTVANDHPQKDRIEALFAERELQQGLVRAQMAQTFGKIGALHDQWLQKLAAGMPEETANQWLVNASKAVTAEESNLSWKGGKVQGGGEAIAQHGNQQYLAVQAMGAG